jgi:hypothetical protein
MTKVQAHISPEFSVREQMPLARLSRRTVLGTVAAALSPFVATAAVAASKACTLLLARAA